MASFLLRAGVVAATMTEMVTACAYGTSAMPRADGGEVKVNTFGYSGAIGPASWHVMNMTTSSVCATGTNQSPIDLTGSVYTENAGSAYSLALPDFDAGAVFENLGTTVEVVGEGGNLTLPDHGNKTFGFVQFHFHLPSEHLDDGTSMAMEVHFVFQAPDSELAVLGIYIDVGTEAGDDAASQAIETVFASVGNISTPGTATQTDAFPMSGFVDLLTSTTFKCYSGSLTTPPCSEGVNWNVAQDTITVSLATYKAARDVLGYNSRFVQNAPGEQNILSMASASLIESSSSSSS